MSENWDVWKAEEDIKSASSAQGLCRLRIDGWFKDWNITQQQ